MHVTAVKALFGGGPTLLAAVLKSFNSDGYHDPAAIVGMPNGPPVRLRCRSYVYQVLAALGLSV
ncbi:hypothetical protein [Roseomonas sp. USHLN139]|uniref:hypothetical protein n=1 Tax=Roseomonas sp. USHLN139 TaxID=3081298 RepID=UPI003B01E64D